MSFITLSEQVRERWFHRFYQVVSLLLIVCGIIVFISGLISFNDAKNEVFTPHKESNAEAMKYNQMSKSLADDIRKEVKELDEIRALYSTIPIGSGGSWKSEEVLNFERDRALGLMAVAFIPWIVLWLAYRAVLYVCMGTKAYLGS
jgi:hypothetical protein